MTGPFADLARWPRRLPGDAAAVRRALDDDWGPDSLTVRHLEDHIATRAGADYAVTFATCSVAIEAALIAAGVSRRAEHREIVITPAFGFVGTVVGAHHLNVQLGMVDVAKGSWLPDSEAMFAFAASASTAGVRPTLLPVNLFGWAVDPLPAADSWGLVFDNCQALGNPAAKGGGLACWSFSSAKMVAAPAGGAVTTDDAEQAEVLRMLRVYGITEPDAPKSRADTGLTGNNWALDAVNAALITERLPYLNADVGDARQTAAVLYAALYDPAGPIVAPTLPATAAPHKVPVWVPADDMSYVTGRLDAAGIPWHRWGTLLPALSAFQMDPARAVEQFPNAARAADELLFLGTETCPVHTWSDRETDYVAETLATINKELA